MFLLGPLMVLSAIGFFCWLVFTLAVFALPAFAGITIGIWSFHTGAGVLGAIVVGLMAAGATFGIGQLLLALVPWTWARLLIVAVYAAPAAVAGYNATLGIARMAMPSPVWQTVFSIIGAIAVGVTAVVRISGMAPPPGQPGDIAQASLRHPPGSGAGDTLPPPISLPSATGMATAERQERVAKARRDGAVRRERRGRHHRSRYRRRSRSAGKAFCRSKHGTPCRQPRPDRETTAAGFCRQPPRSRLAARISMTAPVLSSAPYRLSDGWIWPKAG